MRLVRLDEPLVRGLVDGGLVHPDGWHPDLPSEDTLGSAWLLLAAYEALGLDPAGSPWWLFGVVVEGRVVGTAGFHGPPPHEGPVEVEVGYEVAPALRGRGLATRACALLLDHAWGHGADVVRAEVAPGPHAAASRAVLRANGFRPDGPVMFVAERAVGPRT